MGAGQDVNLSRDRAILARLPRAASPFFAHFGRLTAIQREAIPHVLEGHDTLICAATAAGKTEAACAPLVERQLGRRARWTILYISPTRALINDLYERLASPLAQLQLRLERRTGEFHPDLTRPTHVLLTTPESFDSLLCRGRTRRGDGSYSHVFDSVVAVILDEVHLLHGTARGEQVRWLIERLRRLRREAKAKGRVAHDWVQVVALSATVPDPDAVGAAYLADGRLVIVPGGREIEMVVPVGAMTRVEGALVEYVAALNRSEKVLVFANSRRSVDELTAELRRSLAPYNYEVRAHHGSLARNERETSEEVLRTQARIVVVASSTLEIGVDIGDIDLVVLDEPAPSISALLQRLGRGNRRSGTTRVMACGDSTLHALVHNAMLDAARASWLGPAEHGPQYAVARQQVASYIFQSSNSARQRRKIEDLLNDCADPVVSRDLLDGMIEAGELHETSGRVRLGESWLKRARLGQLFSNIESDRGMTVEDELTGRKIASNISLYAGRGMRAGGHLLETRRRNGFKIEVRRVSDAALAAGEWKYAEQPWMKGAGQPQAVLRYLGLAADSWPVVRVGDTDVVFHFGGAVRRAVIELAASVSRQAPARLAVNGWYLLVPTETGMPRWLEEAGPAILELGIADRVEKLERTLGRPLANRQLPSAVRIAEVVGWLQLKQEVERIASSRWVRVSDPELTKVLRKLHSAIPGLKG